uniref:Claspin n=1 Tax=Elaeophora elaphi TaxID=1147741 RepID=A0A0R3RVA2_9BILA
MADDNHLILPKTPSDADSNSNSGSLFSRRYPDESSSSSSGSKESSRLLLNNEGSSGPMLQSHGAEMVPDTRRRRLLDLPEGLKFQPKIIREDSIDLATNEVGFGFELNLQLCLSEVPASMGKSSGSSQVFRGTTREGMQKSMMKRLVEMRLKGQEKRKAMYDADNGIMSDGSKSMDLCGLTSDEGSKTKASTGGNPREATKELDEETNSGMIEHEAHESDNGDRETISQEDEINERMMNIEDNNEVREVAMENKKIRVSEKGNEGVIGDSNNKFLGRALDRKSGEDERKELPQSGKETCNRQPTLEDIARELRDSEIDSSDSDDGIECGSSSLADDLLSDVAENCSGSFEYPEDDNVNTKPPEYYMSEEYQKILRKRRRKRELMLSTKFYNEENIRAWRRSTKMYKKFRETWDESDRFLPLNDDSHDYYGDSEGDDDNRNEFQSNNEANDEDQRVESVEETGSSDELKHVRKLQIAQKRRERSEYIEEEASLSGDDVGSDEIDDEDHLNVYEAEEGDDDELPDDETIREQLHKQWVKQQKDEEERELLYWKDQLHVDGDGADETDRTFRFKIRLAKRENANEETENGTVGAENVEVDEDELCKRRREISKWKVEERNLSWLSSSYSKNHAPGNIFREEAALHAESISMKGTSPILKAASKIIDKGTMKSHTSAFLHDSLGLNASHVLGTLRDDVFKS